MDCKSGKVMGPPKVLRGTPAGKGTKASAWGAFARDGLGVQHSLARWAKRQHRACVGHGLREQHSSFSSQLCWAVAAELQLSGGASTSIHPPSTINTPPADDLSLFYHAIFRVMSRWPTPLASQPPSSSLSRRWWR
eukprot:341283-Chlamydomonas_euryale.AAC.2